MANEARPKLQLVGVEQALSDLRRSHSFDGGGGGGYDGGMDDRVKALEKFADEARTDLREIGTRLTKIETKMDQFATKEDLSKLGVAMQSEINAQTWKLVTFVCGFGTALVWATYFIAKHAAT